MPKPVRKMQKANAAAHAALARMPKISPELLDAFAQGPMTASRSKHANIRHAQMGGAAIFAVSAPHYLSRGLYPPQSLHDRAERAVRGAKTASPVSTIIFKRWRSRRRHLQLFAPGDVGVVG